LVPEDHWIQDPLVGGGRLVGEVCHFLDLLRYLASSPIDSIDCITPDSLFSFPQTFYLQIKFLDGSTGSINYISNGNKSYPKERLEVFCDSTIQRIDNFKKIITWGNKRLRSKKMLKQDKGQVQCTKKFINSIKNNSESPIPIEEIFEVQNWLLKVQEKINN